MVKYTFGKNWNWTSEIKNASAITDKQIDCVYRLDANPCTLGSCKTNCSGNPYCLNGLGEKKLVNQMQKDSTLSIERDEYLRNLKDYAGLVNLGATCYINTYLQVWYNNLIFREHMLNIKFPKIKLKQNEETDYDAMDSDSMPSLDIEYNECLGTNLQMVFTLMKESLRKSIDPNFFIRAIGLDENMQQDAQEFSQLFLTTIQSSLSAVKTNPNEKSDIIRDLFEGEYSYITECEHCKLQSARHSNFVELSLNIQNCNTIKECMDDMLKVEMMDGDNQYFCDNCNCKRNAKRMTKLAKLPPVLNLQLLRFVYDRNSGYKKKLSNRIKFSEQFDLSTYTNDDENLKAAAAHFRLSDETATAVSEQPIYQLGAILMHVGKTAYSGHYMAQIKNFKTGEWYNFNDEVITKLKRKQQLGCTDDEIENSSSKQDKEANGSNAKTTGDSSESQAKSSSSSSSLAFTSTSSNKTFSTANAYLLVYYRADILKKMEAIDDKASMSNQSEIVAKDNLRLENWFHKYMTSKVNQNETKTTERVMIHQTFELLWAASAKNNESSAVQSAPSSALVSTMATTTNAETKNQDDVKLARKVSRKNLVSLSAASATPDSTTNGTHNSCLSSSSSSDVNVLQKKNETIDNTVKNGIKSKLYYVTVEFLKKLLSMQSNVCLTDAAAINSIQKYLCPHKRLNPLAINRFKIVSSQGVDHLLSIYGVKATDIGALEVLNEESTRCRQCVINCYEYLKFKDKLKQDGKLVRQLVNKVDTVCADYDGTSSSTSPAVVDTVDVSDDEMILSPASSSRSQNGHADVEKSTTEKSVEKSETNGVDDPDLMIVEVKGPSGTSSLARTLATNTVVDVTKEVFADTKNAPGSGSRVPGSSVYMNGCCHDTTENNKENASAPDTSSSTTINGKQALCYWIGKESLRSWQNLALRKLESQLPSFKFSDSAGTSQTDTIKKSQDDEQSDSTDVIECKANGEYDLSQSATKGTLSKSKQHTSKTTTTVSSNSTNALTTFNEDITCPHNGLSPTKNKRLINSYLWHLIFEPYFYSNITDQIDSSNNSKMRVCPIFTSETSECKLCLKTNEEISNKKIEVKNQKEILNDLYFNRNRPSIDLAPIGSSFYIVATDFIREWRNMAKQNAKFKDIKIANQMLICQHMCCPFDQNTIDFSIATLVTPEEWTYLSSNYDIDMEIRVTKMPKREAVSSTNEASVLSNGSMHENGIEIVGVVEPIDTDKINDESYELVFRPESCHECLAQNELNKYQFRNEKIFIRQVDDDNPTKVPVSALPSSIEKQTATDTSVVNGYKTKKSDDDEDETKCKKARFSSNLDLEIEQSSTTNDKATAIKTPARPGANKLSSTHSSSSNLQQASSSSTSLSSVRRSKRARKCKGDLELIVSSSDSTKRVKTQIASHLSRMISEQHLFYKSIELENEKQLSDYRIMAGEVLYLKLDQATNDDMEHNSYELAHLPEIGFKGTNLLK